jgi:hypothetical protein
VRLFPTTGGSSDLEDITTSSDNKTAADFILRELRTFTEDPSTRVFASIAGGRKTMGALLMSCMSLLGREQDRVLHVLVNRPFDEKLVPPFLFPERGAQHTHVSGSKRVRAIDARIELIDVPFVRMRGWYEQAFKTVPPSYATLVAGVQGTAPSPVNHPTLTVDRANGRLLVDGEDGPHLSSAEFAVLAMLLALVKKGLQPRDQDVLVNGLLALKSATGGASVPNWVSDLRESTMLRGDDLELNRQDIRKRLSEARRKLRQHPHLSNLADLIAPDFRKSKGFYPVNRIELSGPDVFRTSTDVSKSAPHP